MLVRLLPALEELGPLLPGISATTSTFLDRRCSTHPAQMRSLLSSHRTPETRTATLSGPKDSAHQETRSGCSRYCMCNNCIQSAISARHPLPQSGSPVCSHSKQRPSCALLSARHGRVNSTREGASRWRVTCAFDEDSSSPPCYSNSSRKPGCCSCRASVQSLDAPHTAMLFLSDRILRFSHWLMSPNCTPSHLSCHSAQQFAHPAELNGIRTEGAEEYAIPSCLPR